MWELIEIPVTAATQRVQLPDVQQLRSQPNQIIVVKSIAVITDKVLANAMTIAGTTAPLAELQKISLVLYSEGWERGHYMPLLRLNDQADADSTAATTIPFRNETTKLADWRNVDWPKSYLQYANGTQAANFPYVVMLWVSYLKLNMNEQPIYTPR